MDAHTDIAATGWVARLPRALGALRAAGAARPADRRLAAVPARAVGRSCSAGRPAAAEPAADRAVRRRRRGDARRRLRGQRHVGPRHRPAGGAHRRPAARLRRRLGMRAGAGVPARAAARVGLLDPAAARPAGAGARGGFAAAGGALSAGQARHLVAAAGDGLHLRLRRADGLCRRNRADRSRLARRSTPRRSCGISASTRSMRTRTARTTRWSACAPPRACSASARRAVPRRVLRGDAGAAGAGGLAGRAVGAGSIPRWLLPACCSRGRCVRLDIDDPALLPAAVPRQPRGWAGGRRWRSCSAGCERRRRRSCRPQTRARARAAGAGDRAASGDRDHADLAGDARTWLHAHNVEPPFWAFAWPGGQALARHVLDHPRAGRRPARARFRRRLRDRGDRLRAGGRGVGGGGRDRPARRRRDRAERARQRCRRCTCWPRTWSASPAAGT